MSDVNHTFIADLKQLASNSDALILAAAADKAEAIIDAEVLQALGKDGYLINVARGKLVNEVDLVAALAAGEIAGAALDVFVDEPNVPETLFANEKVVLQPHRASATLQTRTRMGEMVVASLVDSFAGRIPQGSVTD
jgi:lactate dehydrogenase-like 2-hydroxyacid dehydrogenase